MKLLAWNIPVFGGGMARVRYVVPKIRGKRVLDLGVVQHDARAADSENWLHRHIAREAIYCLGVDSSEEGIRELQRQGFNVRHGDVQRLELDDGSRHGFDVVVAGDIIEHLHDLNGFFQSIDKYLAPNGIVLLLTANAWFFLRVAQALRGRVYENPEHTAWFSIGTLTELLARFGYEVQEACYGSSEGFLALLPLPQIMRHTSVWVVARRKSMA